MKLRGKLQEKTIRKINDDSEKNLAVVNALSLIKHQLTDDNKGFFRIIPMEGYRSRITRGYSDPSVAFSQDEGY